MPYMDETGLAYYSGKLKPWIASQPVKTLPSSLYPWTLTDKAGAVTCWPVGGTPLLPTVDFMFSETGPASGDKGPETPSAISGVSDFLLGKGGKNLITNPYYYTSRTINNVSFTVNQDGSVVANGTASANTAFNLTTNIPVTPGFTYVISGCPSGGVSKYGVYVDYRSNRDSGYVTNRISDGSKNQAYTPTRKLYAYVYIKINKNITVDNVCFYPQFEIGNVATEYEKPATKLNLIPLGNTYYGGTVDLATGVMTVTHVAVTPDASTVDISSAPAALPLDYADTYGRTITSADGASLVVGSTGGTVVYKLATPQTVQLTPTEILSLAQADKYTPRLNTLYTDASAVQVGYVKSPIREEYELQQAIVAQGGNI